jgi:hypothetical protein
MYWHMNFWNEAIYTGSAVSLSVCSTDSPIAPHGGDFQGQLFENVNLDKLRMIKGG